MTTLHQLHRESRLEKSQPRLDEIIAHKKQELNRIKAQIPLEIYQVESATLRLIHSLRQKLDRDNHFHFICEIKKASPSRGICLLYTSPSPRDGLLSRMPSSA